MELVDINKDRTKLSYIHNTTVVFLSRSAFIAFGFHKYKSEYRGKFKLSFTCLNCLLHPDATDEPRVNTA